MYETAARGHDGDAYPAPGTLYDVGGHRLHLHCTATGSPTVVLDWSTRTRVSPFGIDTTIINPGWFRTGLADPESLIRPALTIDDYTERSAGDPDKLAAAVLTIFEKTVTTTLPSPGLTRSRWQNARSTKCRSHRTTSCPRH